MNSIKPHKGVPVDGAVSLLTKVTGFQEFTDVPRGVETVLLVEDEPMVRAVSATVLRAQGYTVIEATNGEDALGISRASPQVHIHLLLTDIMMPRMGGVELAARFKELHPDAKLLLTSGFADESVWEGSRLARTTPFIPKPFLPVALAVKVRDVLES